METDCIRLHTRWSELKLLVANKPYKPCYVNNKAEAVMPAFSLPSSARKLGANKLTYTLAPHRSQIPPLQISLPKLPYDKQNTIRVSQPFLRSRIPAKVSTVSLVGRRDKLKSTPSLFAEENETDTTYASLEECLDSRPPLRLDLSGPKPTTYDPPATLPWETQSPSYTMRPKTQPEKDTGGDRVAWNKQWIASHDIWTYRVHFDNRCTWPSPAHYMSRPTVGGTQVTLPQSPSHSMARRRAFDLSKKGSDQEPAPNQYNYCIDKMLRRFPSYTIQEGRKGGTTIWTAREPVPGPGTYNPKVYRASTKPCAPCFSMARSERKIGITRNCTF